MPSEVRAGTPVCPNAPTPDAAAFAKGLGDDVLCGERRAIHRQLRKPYKTRVRMPSMLDPHVEDIERWLAAEPRLTALIILARLAARYPDRFGPPQHTIVQRLLKALRRKAATQLVAASELGATPTLPSALGTAISRSTAAPTASASALPALAAGNIFR